MKCYDMMKRYTCSMIFGLLFAFSHTEAHNDSSTFELRQGFIIISATLDGISGSYILDSGAPGLVLNSIRFELEGTDVDVSGTGGRMSGQIVNGHNFVWNSINLKEVEALSIDLSYLETALGVNIAGLVGMDVLAGHDILIDYSKKQVVIGDQTCCSKAELDQFVALPIVKHDHVLIAKMSYRGTDMLFGIDTGSKSNILGRTAADRIFPEDYRMLDKIRLIGADQREILTEEWLVSAFRASNIRMDAIPFVIQDLESINRVQGIELDGILGHEFFQDSQIMISKDRDTIYVKSNSLPLYAQK